jgi:hypothetical protein
MKAGDKIYLAIDNQISFCEVSCLRFFCTILKNDNEGIIIASRFHKGLFYGFGYDGGKRYLFLKKIWHYHFAVLCEKVRLRLLEKWAK